MNIDALISQTMDELSLEAEAKRQEADERGTELLHLAYEAMGELWEELEPYAQLQETAPDRAMWTVEAEALRLAPFTITAMPSRLGSRPEVWLTAPNSRKVDVTLAGKFLVERRAAFGEWLTRKREHQTQQGRWLLERMNVEPEAARAALEQLERAWPERSEEWQALYREWEKRDRERQEHEARQAAATQAFREAMAAWKMERNRALLANNRKAERLQQEIDELPAPEVFKLSAFGIGDDGSEVQFYVLGDHTDVGGYWKKVQAGQVIFVKVTAPVVVVMDIDEREAMNTFGTYVDLGVRLVYPPGFDIKTAVKELGLESLPDMPKCEPGTINYDDYWKILEDFDALEDY